MVHYVGHVTWATPPPKKKFAPPPHSGPPRGPLANSQLRVYFASILRSRAPRASPSGIRPAPVCTACADAQMYSGATGQRRPAAASTSAANEKHVMRPVTSRVPWSKKTVINQTNKARSSSQPAPGRTPLRYVGYRRRRHNAMQAGAHPPTDTPKGQGSTCQDSRQTHTHVCRYLGTCRSVHYMRPG